MDCVSPQLYIRCAVAFVDWRLISTVRGYRFDHTLGFTGKYLASAMLISYYKYGHEVDPTIKRWQQADRNGKLIDRPAIGVGVLRVRPSGHALLYQKGYARKPLDVVKLVPEFLKKTFRRLGGMRFRGVSNKASPVTTAASVGITEMKNSVAEGLLSVIQATQFATVTFGFALLTTLISVFLRAAPQSAAQWVATLGFVLAWAAVSSGVYQKSDEWLYGACAKSLKWWGFFFVPVAILNLFFTVANNS
jgi:hypothetical protein